MSCFGLNQHICFVEENFGLRLLKVDLGPDRTLEMEFLRKQLPALGHH